MTDFNTGGQSPVFINPLEDAQFKILFGPGNKRNMIGLLKAILGREITDITYIDTEKLGISISEGHSHYDLSVLFSDGTRCIVEMQKANLNYFNYRSVLYSSHLVQLQASEEKKRQREEYLLRNEKSHWNYYFCPVYLIGILENGSLELDRSLDRAGADGYLFHFRNREIYCGADMNVDVNYIYLCLDRYNKSREESKSLLEQFTYSLKNMKNESRKPTAFEYEEIQNFYDSAILANLSAEQAHTLKIKEDMTTENDILVAIDEACERATQKVTKEVTEKVTKEVTASVTASVTAKVNAENAARLKAKNYPIADICEVTGLSEEEVRRL